MMALLGLQMKNGVIYTYRSKATTKKILRALIKLIQSVENPSRWNKPDIELKAADLRQELSIKPAEGKAKLFANFLKSGKGKGASGGNGLAPANPPPPSGKPVPKPKPPKPPSLEKIAQDSQIVHLLDTLGYYKLQSLYYSLTSTRLDNNVPMLSVVAWSLLECLAAADGSQKPFPQHLNKTWLFNAGLIPTIKESEKQKPYLQAIKDISLKGNASKHDVQSGGFDKNELATNIHILNPLLKELIKQAIAKK